MNDLSNEAWLESLVARYTTRKCLAELVPARRPGLFGDPGVDAFWRITIVGVEQPVFIHNLARVTLRDEEIVLKTIVAALPESERAPLAEPAPVICEEYDCNEPAMPGHVRCKNCDEYRYDQAQECAMEAP